MKHMSLILALVLQTKLFAENVEEPLGLQTADGEYIEGFVDWSEHVLVVYGSAAALEHISNPVQKRLMGFRGAKVVAFRNLLEMVGQVQVDSETRVQPLWWKVTHQARVQGLIRGARVHTGSQSKSVDGAYRLALELPLRGAFSSATYQRLRLLICRLACGCPTQPIRTARVIHYWVKYWQKRHPTHRRLYMSRPNPIRD